MGDPDRERLERQANRLELVSRWADDLAHEIKNPLHAMVINLELVKRRAGGDPEPVIERAEVVEAELHRVHELVDSLLRLVRPWPATTTAAVDKVFAALLPVFAARARIRKVEYHHEPGEGIAAMPPGDLALVLLNLADNAINAAPEGGAVRTSIVLDEGDVRITITDTGTGLTGPAHTLESAAPEDGRSGLGLAVSRRLVEHAGGTLRISSADEGGVEAVFTVPRTGSSSASSA